MELTIEHVIPYYTHNLILMWKGLRFGNYFDWNTLKRLEDKYDDLKIKDLKPALIPMSYLIKEIKYKGKKFIPVEVLPHFKQYNNEIKDMFFKMDMEWKDKLTYDDMLKLFEWNFDVFGLIENNLAIDINTL